MPRLAAWLALISYYLLLLHGTKFNIDNDLQALQVLFSMPVAVVQINSIFYHCCVFLWTETLLKQCLF